MHIWEDGVLRDKLDVVLWDVEDQVSKRLPSSPSFNCWLQEIIKGNLYCPFPFPFIFYPWSPVYVWLNKLYSLLAGWNDTCVVPPSGEEEINLEDVDPHFNH